MNQPTRLWELSDEIQQLEDAIAIIQEDETISDEDRENRLEETFNRWLERSESFKVKAERLAAYIRHQEALAAVRKEEAKRINALAKQAENQADRLRRYLTVQMVRSNVKRIDGVTTKIGLRKKQPTVLLNIPAEELPAEYVKVTHKPELTKIRAALKGNTRIDWAYLSDSHQYSVTIR